MAISSFRPLLECEEIARNQIRAKASWERVFDSILLFGPFTKALASPKTTFVPCSNFPPIRLLILAAGMSITPAAILNADIVLVPHARNLFDDTMRSAKAATSFRLEFDPQSFDLANARKTDNGLDVFMARPEVWQAVLRFIPGHLRIGHSTWDSILYMHWRELYQGKFVDLSRHKVVFHPRHENRKRIA